MIRASKRFTPGVGSLEPRVALNADTFDVNNPADSAYHYDQYADLMVQVEKAIREQEEIDARNQIFQQMIEEAIPLSEPANDAELKDALAPMPAPPPTQPDPSYLEQFMDAMDQIIKDAMDSQVPLFQLTP